MTHTRQTIRHLPIEMLQKHPGNIRNDIGDVTDLARSIVEHGILQPLVLTELSDQPDRFLVLAGHRRLAAARLAKLTSVPCVIRHGLGDDQVEQLAVMLVENCQRRDLNPVERAEAYGALRNHGLSMSEIARRTGSQPSTVSYYLNLLLLDDDSRTAVRDGDLPSTVAIAAVREQRQAGRLRDDQPLRGRPKLKITPPHFGPRHPLAPRVRSSCNHSTRTKVGGVGCGPCWETTIRDDQQRPQPTVVADPPPASS